MMSVCQPYGQVGNIVPSTLALVVLQEIVCLCENLKTVLRCHLIETTPVSETAGVQEGDTRKDFLEN